MTEDGYEGGVPAGLSRYVPLLVYVLAALVVILIPLKITVRVSATG